MVTREELEFVVPKKKGPTGCGKTSTLKCIAKELKLPIREYSETTDTTLINHEMRHEFDEEELRSIDMKKASKFCHFVVNNIRFNPLYTPESEGTPQFASAESEFESDDEEWLETKKPVQPPVERGVIIHIETPLTFARSQKVLVQCINKLYKIVRELSKSVRRRVAIIFENLDSDVIPLSTKIKSSLKIHSIKFNRITDRNMRNFLENIIRRHNNLVVDKETANLLINDCDGDMRACINTVELLRHGSQYTRNSFLGLNNNDFESTIQNLQFSKRQKLNPETKRVQINPTLLRDISKSKNFFHLLGKIFYQKRLYPERKQSSRQNIRSIERPYATENTTTSLVERIDTSSQDLIAWLHHHYHKFCHDFNIEKAAMFLENISDVDNISINSTQSSQFYETHSVADQIQLYLSIESTVFSLYEDQSQISKPSHKKLALNGGTFIVKSSVDTHNINSNGELYSFNRPISLNLYKCIEDHRRLLDHFIHGILKQDSIRATETVALTDYIPYLNYMAFNWSKISNHPKVNGSMNSKPKLLHNDVIITTAKALEEFEPDSTMDFDIRHERLQEIIDDIEERTTKTAIKSEIQN